MANAYDVTPQDVAAEVVNLYPQGFSETTRPSAALVSVWIAEADVRAQLALANVASGTPSEADAAYPLARGYIVEATLLRVLRTAYTGKVAPAEIADLMRISAENTAATLKALTAFGEQAVGPTVEVPPAAVVVGDVPYRELIIDDDDLDWTVRRF